MVMSSWRAMLRWFASDWRRWSAEPAAPILPRNSSMAASSTSPCWTVPPDPILPPGEMDFSTFPEGKPRIIGHRAKWHEDSFEYNNTPRSFHVQEHDRSLVEQLKRLALDCWQVFDLRGYVRVDFRVDRTGQPWILEVNANPCLSPDAGYAAALDEAGISYDEAVQRIVEAAVAGRETILELRS